MTYPLPSSPPRKWVLDIVVVVVCCIVALKSSLRVIEDAEIRIMSMLPLLKDFAAGDAVLSTNPDRKGKKVGLLAFFSCNLHDPLFLS